MEIEMDNDDLLKQLLDEFVHEGEIDQSADHNNSQSQFIPIDIIFTEGRRNGSEIAWAPDEQCIYYYNGDRKEYDANGFTCSNDNCDVRFFKSRLTGKCFKEIDSPIHTCSHYETYKEICLFKHMKERCKTAPVSATTRSIYEETVHMLVSFDTV